MSKIILFFARDYQAKFFPLLKSEKYNSIFVVLNKKEKEIVIANGGETIICLEDEFDNLELTEYDGTYLKYSYGCDRNYINLNLKEREIILKKTITFWRKILDKYNPDLIINETVAIELSEVLGIEAERKHIKYMSWMSFPKKNTFYWQIDPFHNSLEDTLDTIVPSEQELEDAITFNAGLRNGLEKPFYVSRKSIRYSFKIFIQSIWSVFRLSIFSLKISKLKRIVSYGNYIGTYNRNIKLFLLSVFCSAKKYDDIDSYLNYEFIFYPLHYEPEAVLFYMGYFFDNQATVIENSLKCIGENQILVEKEHPQQPGMLLEKRFREIKKRYPNLLFIRAEEPSTKILLKCDVIITLGSTAGLEALTLGKKVINLGKVFYDSFEGINNCTSFKEVYDLIRGNVSFKEISGLDLFMAKMLHYIMEGNPFPHDNLYSAGNLKNITKAIENELSK